MLKYIKLMNTDSITEDVQNKFMEPCLARSITDEKFVLCNSNQRIQSNQNTK